MNQALARNCRRRLGGVAPMSLARMRAVVKDGVLPLRTKSVSTCVALGATLAEPVRPATAFPAEDTAAMDGYAVCGPGPWHLTAGALTAGSAPSQRLAEGTAIVIATGAHVPPATSYVLRQENSRLLFDGRLVDALGRRSATGDDIRRRGENWTPDRVLASSGTLAGPAVISTALSADRETLVVRGPLRAHMVTTGDEISVAGTPEAGQIRDSLGPVLPTMARHVGYVATTVSHRHDRDFRHRAGIGTTDAHVTFVVGGTGQGAADHLREVLDDAGSDILIDRVACRPGGSQLLAILPGGHVVVGLPGNPLAAIVAIMTTGRAVADALLGRDTPSVRGRLAEPVIDHGGGARIHPARPRPDGTWQIDPAPRTAHLAGLIDRPALAVLDSSVSRTTAEILPLPIC